MSSRRTAPLLLAILVIVPTAAAQDGHLWVGPNVNMVSGTTFPDGDPFLQRQNEPSVAVSTRNTMHLVGSANDYRAVDIPFLIDEEVTGDAWLGVFKSFDGGLTWKSTLLPGYPQDYGSQSPLFGYQAGADPVVRAGTHGLFYLSGIVFDRADPGKSAVFVSRFMDLNNLEGGDPISHIDTGIVWNKSAADSVFIDKPWLAVDVPRAGAEQVTLQVPQDGGFVEQTVDCGNVYLAWAEITGIAPNYRSTIMFTRSTDCGQLWDTPIPLSDENTMNQGVSIAVSPVDGTVWVAWRQFNTSPPCTHDAGYWKDHPEEWPIEGTLDSIVPVILGGKTFETNDDLMDLLNTPPKGGDARLILTHQLIPAILNAASTNPGQGLLDAIAGAKLWLEGNEFEEKKPKGTDKDEGLAWKDLLEAYNEGLMSACIGVAGPQNAMMAVRSTPYGVSFPPVSPTEVSAVHGFEQGPTEISFRTNAYPTMTVDDLGRAYIAWSERGQASPRGDIIEGDGRIVITSSDDNSSWEPLLPIDRPLEEGHQIQPTITFAGGKLVLVYYDFREDVSGFFGQFIADWPYIGDYRHTVDVRAAQSDPGPIPEFTVYNVSPNQPSGRISRYAFMTNDPESPDYSGDLELYQIQYNPPNLPIFVLGSKPFFGDYIDVAASPPFLRDENGNWKHNTDSEDGAPVFHAVWTDNRDVEAPHDGDWSNYIPPTEALPGTPSTFDKDNFDVPTCDPGTDDEGQTRIRDQNIYTARFSQGLYVAAPGGARPLEGSQRAFVIYVRNDTFDDNLDNDLEGRLFRLTIENQLENGEASFLPDQLVTTLDVEIGPFSSIARTVFVTSSETWPSIRVSVEEIGGDLQSSILLNSDPSSPLPRDSAIWTAEDYNLAMMNRNIENLAMMNPTMLAMMNLAMMNPGLVSEAMKALAMMNLAMMNLAMMNPSIENLAMMNLAMMNPAIYALAMMNPALTTPAEINLAMMNLAMMNPALQDFAEDGYEFPEITWAVTNTGDVATAYSVNLIADQFPESGFINQLFIYKVYTTPVADGCELMEETQHQMLVNVTNVDILDLLTEHEDFLDSGLEDSELENATFALDEGETAYITLWMIDLVPGDGDDYDPASMGAGVVAHPPKDGDGDGDGGTIFESDLGNLLPVDLSIDNIALASGEQNSVYPAATLTATGGYGPRTWSLDAGSPPLPPGLTLSAGGVISGTPTMFGDYPFVVRVTDSTQYAVRSFSIEVTQDLVIGTEALPYGQVGALYSQPLVASGNPTAHSWSSATLPGWLTLDSDGTLWGTPPAGGTSTFTVQVIAGPQTASKLLSLTANEPGLTFTNQPSSVVSGGNIGPVTITLTDGADPPIPLAGVSVNLVLDSSPCSGSTLSNGGSQTTGPTGQATWFSPSVSSGGWGFTLAVYSAGPDPIGTSGPFDIEGFCAGPDMADYRERHTATRLADGRVLIAGGAYYGGSGWTVLNTAEVYDPSSGTFSPVSDILDDVRRDHTATLLDDGRVLIAGGQDEPHPSVKSAEVYDPATDSFETVGDMAVDRHDHRATLLPDGRVLVSGGIDDTPGNTHSSVEVYDPIAQSFDLIFDSMSDDRARHTSTLLPNGKVLLAAGAELFGSLLTADIFDPASESITSAGSLTTRRNRHSATLLETGGVLIAAGQLGGTTYLDLAQIYDPTAGFISPEITMIGSRFVPQTVSLPNGKVLITGGRWDAVETPPSPDAAEIYNPSNGSFTGTGAMSVERVWHTATSLANGSVLVTGGEDGFADFNTTELFYPIGGQLYQNVEWSRQFGTSDWDTMRSVSAQSDRVFVTGSTDGNLPGESGAGANDVYVRGYDDNGIELWTHQFGTSGFDNGRSIAVDGSGVYVTGEAQGALPGQTYSGVLDAFVRKYTKGGAEVWTRQFGSSALDGAEGIAVDATGVYLAGHTEGALPGQTSLLGTDAFVRKYDFFGNHLWTRQFGTAVNDSAYSIAVDSNGVYVFGETDGQLPGQTKVGPRDAFVRKYDFNGNELWTRQFGTTDLENAFGITADETGIYVAGSTWGEFPGYANPDRNSEAYVRKYDAGGNALWTRQFGANFCEIAGVSVDTSGLYVAGSVQGILPGQIEKGSSAGDAFVRKYDFDGQVIWTRQIGGISSAFGTSVFAGTSGVYLGGQAMFGLPSHSPLGSVDAILLKMEE